MLVNRAYKRTAWALFLVLGIATAPAVRAQDSDSLEQVALQFEALLNGEAMDASRFYDDEAMLERSGGFDLLPTDEVDEFIGGFTESFSLERLFSEQFAPIESAFLRLADRNGEVVARFRLIDADAELYYLDLLFEPDPSGTYRIVDFFHVSRGSWMSALIRNVILQMHVNQEGDTDWASTPIGVLLVLQQALEHGRYEEGLTFFESIPPDLQANRLLLLVALDVALMVDDATFLRVAKRFDQLFPDDPAHLLVALDLALVKKEWSRALSLLDRLDESLGGDPYLDVLRSTIYFGSGELVQAQMVAERLIHALPGSFNAHEHLMLLAYDLGDFERVTDMLLVIDHQFGAVYSPDALRQSPAWAEFVVSPAYDRWLSERPN